MLEIEIDGKNLTVPDGSTVMDAANMAGVYIPHFCYHKKLSIAANCRMCLVQVEKAPKPLPACATPVTNGMKVMTHSDLAVKAQKGVMEFLLINHPLDCPICDQGGECQLQDIAVGYGGDGARFQEEKRVVVNKDIGPLISTDMTRCIHCSRCVRFGQEIAGIMEMGIANRSERSEVMTFVSRAISSELSGNSIDLCPVGALTSKPFRYSARSWELSRRKGIGAHDGLGTNLVFHVKNHRVMRAVPRENEAINECWASDRDRFAYQGLYAADRLTTPMVKIDGQWREVSWESALEKAAAILKQAALESPQQIGALAAPNATLEELHLFQKLLRNLGVSNIDHRLRQLDFSADVPGKPSVAGVPFSVAELEQVEAALVVGSSMREEHPLLAHRLRKAVVKKRAQLHVIHSRDMDWLVPVDQKTIVPPSDLLAALGRVLLACAQRTKAVLDSATLALIAGLQVDETAQAMAASLLASRENSVIVLGNFAQQHPQYAALAHVARQIAGLMGARLGVLAPAANSVGAAAANVLPGVDGLNIRQMLEQPRRYYVLFAVEPAADTAYTPQLQAALSHAKQVIAFSAFKAESLLANADVLLPITPFTETSGTFVNMEGRVQSFHGAVKPLGESRPGWKVLRALGSVLELLGFNQQDSEQVRAEVVTGHSVSLRDETTGAIRAESLPKVSGYPLIAEVGLYASDAIVRRADALQQTALAKQHAVLRVAQDVLSTLGVEVGAQVLVNNHSMTIVDDVTLPNGCVGLSVGTAATAFVDSLAGGVTVAVK